MRTEIVHASEMSEKVFDVLIEMRTRSQREEYDRALAAYEKKRGKRNEVEEENKVNSRAILGYWELPGERPKFVQRPSEPNRPSIWYYNQRERVGGHFLPSTQGGLLGSSLFNRNIRPERVESYVNAMVRGEWVDLLSDPISITDDGHVINGQHRLAAIADTEDQCRRLRKTQPWQKTDPAFLVLWGVEHVEALYTDGSHRTAVDEKTIAVKLICPAA